MCPLLLAAIFIALPVAAVAAEKPNFVIVFADDMGYGDPRVYNARSRIPTPAIDELALNDMRFNDAHTASSVCTPSRYGLLTGRYPWRSRLPVGITQSWGLPVIADDRATLGKLLQQQGYRTAAIGKWHLGWDWPLEDGRYVSDELDTINPAADARESFGERVDFSRPIRSGPTTRGFDYYFGDDVPNFPPYMFIENDRARGTPSERMPRHKSQRAGPMLFNWDLWAAQPTIADHAVEWLREQTHSDQPFFLYMPLLGPHTPIVPSAEFRGLSDAGPYGDWVAQMDSILGRVVDVLEESGKIDNTVVIFTSDNGSPARSGIGTIGQTNTVTELYSHVPNAPWRGLKADAWEAGHRVPFIVRWDGRVDAGATNDDAICLTDVYASIAEIVGAEVQRDAAEDSFSLLPLLLPDAPGNYQRNEVVHSSANGTFAIRKSGYKLILSDGSGGFSSPRGERTDPDGDGPTQLYLLSDDPQEHRNLADSRQAKAHELRSELNRIRAAGRSRP